VVDDREARAREAVQRMKRNTAQLFSKETSRKFYRAFMEVADVDILVALAREGDKDALEILRRHADGARRAGMNVSQSFHEFVWEYFVDGPPAAKSGSGPKDSGLMHLTIAVMVRIVSRDYGFPEYRNSEYRGKKAGPMTACRLVAEEMGFSERTIEDIWGERKAAVLRTG
jgi:hypothetical protein